MLYEVITNYKNYYPKDDEYIFILGFNQDKIPKIYKDDKYLSDLELEEIGSDTSLKRNNLETSKLFKFIKSTKNIIISYKLASNFMEFSPSNYIKEIGSNCPFNSFVMRIYSKTALPASRNNFV